MIKRGSIVRLVAAENVPLFANHFTQYDGRIGIVLGPGKYDGPNDSNFYEVLVGTIKMTVIEQSLEEV